jgi:hypothetical protein
MTQPPDSSATPTPELISAAYCALAWIDRKTETVGGGDSLKASL